MFEEWGFTIADSRRLKIVMEQLAYYAYLAGEYELGKLDRYGQRINIAVTITDKNGRQLSFKTGWMVYPDGKIKLITPFGDKIL